VDSKNLEELLPLFWRRPEYMNAWRMCFEQHSQRLSLLKRVLHHLPHDRGTVEFVDDYGGNQFVILLTSDLDNVASWENQAWILTVLIETGAIGGLGVEGAFTQFDFSRYQAAPDPSRKLRVGLEFLRARKIMAHTFVGMIGVHTVDTFGIDDPPLYESILQIMGEHGPHGPEYWSKIKQRAPVMFSNLLRLMDEKTLAIVGVCQTDYNFDAFHGLLRERKISHAGIRSTMHGQHLDDIWNDFYRDYRNPFRKLLRKWWPKFHA
jgi:hypothetical protein